MVEKMTPKQEKWLKKWEETRKNKWKFVVTHGLAYGIIFFLLNLLIFWLMNGLEVQLKTIIYYFVSGVIEGLLFVLYMWWVYDKQYKKYLKHKNKIK